MIFSSIDYITLFSMTLLQKTLHAAFSTFKMP